MRTPHLKLEVNEGQSSSSSGQDFMALLSLLPFFSVVFEVESSGPTEAKFKLEFF